VFTSHSYNSAPDRSYVYDREGFTQISQLPVASRKILMDSQNHVYSYAGSDSRNPDIPNVIQIINVNLTPSTTPISWQNDGLKLLINKSVTDLVYSSDGASLFAISSESNQLMRIRTSDMTVQETRTIGSNPNSIYIDHDDLYISNASATQIIKVNTLSGTSVNGAVYSWDVGNFVSQVVYGNQKLIYTALDMSVSDDPGIHVINTATGTKVNYATSIYPGRMVLSLGDNALYFGEKSPYSTGTSTAIKFNLTNFSQQAVSQAYSNVLGTITVNGNDLYFASNLLDKNTLVQIPAWKGYFGAAVIAAKGANVFAQDSVWDRDSYTMQYLLPFIAKNVLTLPDGQIVVVSEDGKTIQKFTSTQALHDYAPELNAPSLQISTVNFNDNDANTREISGNLSWYTTPGTSYISSYTVYFLNQNLIKIGSKIAEIPYAGKGSSYNYSIPKTSIPAGAMYLGVYSKNASGESSSAATVMISDYVGGGSGGGGSSTYFEYTLEDQNPIRGKVHPLVNWYTPIETIYSGYQLIFTDASGTALGSAYSVPKNSSSFMNYHIDIAENLVPAGAVYLDLRPMDLSGNISTEMYRMQVFDNTMSSPVIAGTNPAIPVPDLFFPYIYDEDSSRGNIGGSISWYDLSTDGAATSYDLYFVDKNNVKLQSIAEVAQSKLFRPSHGFYYPSYEITLPNGTAIPAGAERIGIFGKNNLGESTSGYYFGLWDNIEFYPISNYVEDIDTSAKNFEGVLHWVPFIDETSVKNYVVKFIDSIGAPIGGTFAQVNKGQQQYNVSILDTQIPAGVSKVRLSAINSANDEKVLGDYYLLVNNIASEPVSNLPIAYQTPVGYLQQRDDDGNKGEVGGYLSFYANNNYYNPMRYEVYFVDDLLQKLKPIISLPVNQNGSYETTIPMNTQIPIGATKIAVYAVSTIGMSAPYTTNLIDRTYERSLTSDQILITNNKTGTPDSITVSSLNPSDVVRVYRDSSSANSFLYQVVEANSTSVNFTIPQLGTGAGNLYFTVQRGGGIPSLKIEKAYNAEPVDQTPPNPVGGGGGGVGGGGGGGGKSLPTRDANGKMTYDVQPAHIDMLIDLSNAAKPQLVLDATVNQHIDITTVSFDADIVKIAADKGKPIVVKTNDAQLTFPVNAVAVNDLSNTIKLKITNSEFPTMSSFLAASPLVEFTLTEKDKTITAFNSPVEVVFHYDPSKVKDSSKLGVYWLDETTNTWTYVGGTRNGDGTITASLPHFSKYAVLEKNEQAQALTTFADIQGHWAQADIEQLVSKQIVDGMDADSFQPNSDMTRAQFVTILKKALNLPVQTVTKSFADVADDSWYKDAVYAAYAANITGGTSDSTFAPDDNVTREQLAVMVVGAYLNATGKELSDLATTPLANYADASSISDWAKQYVAAATALGLLNGMDDTHFAPAQNSTRAQVAAVVVRMLKQISDVK
jgi:hypothetical protein